MDIRMPGLDGIEATRRIAAHEDLSEVHVIILTTFDLDEYVFEAIRAGAGGFLVKDTSPAELLHAIRVVAAGDALMSPGVTRRLIEEFAARTRSMRPVPGIDDLTQREREVVAWAAEGLSNEEIAVKLYMSPSTAKTHALRAMGKLGARDRAQLVAIAYQAGLVRPGWNAELHSGRSARVLHGRPGRARSAARGGGSSAAAPASRVHARGPRRRRTPR
jgi:DNA-binding NarL/FixJ family response regulator